MNLTILASRFWPELHGGVETHMWRFARHLVGHGANVHVITENGSNLPERETIMPNLTVRRHRPVDTSGLGRWGPIVELKTWRRRLRNEKPQGPIWASNALLGAASVLAGMRDQLIYNPAGCVDAMRHIGRLYPHVTTMQRPRTIAWMDRYAFRRAKHVVVSSQSVARQYRRFAGERDNVYVSPLGVSRANHGDGVGYPDGATRSMFGIEPRAFVIGFVGRLDPSKMVDFLFDAAMQASIDPSTRILIAGEGNDESRLRRRAAQLGVASQIIWAGRVKEPAIAYGAMDVLALPSVYEPFGLVMVEAMRAGVPVLARSGNDRCVFTAADEIIKHQQSGYIVHSNDPGDLSARLRELRRNPMRLRAMQIAAKATAAPFTWERYTRQQLDLIERGWPDKEHSDVTYPYQLAA